MKSRKSSSILLVSVLCLGLLLSGFTYGTDRRAQGATISEETIAFFQNLDCEIMGEATIEVLPIQTAARSQVDYALCVTQNIGNQYQKDVFVFLKSDEEGVSVDNAIPMAARSSQVISYDPDSFTGITMHGTAIYTSYGGGRYRPQGVSWYYTNSNTSLNVQFMSVRYDCEGSLVEYPGFAYITAPYEHSITASAYNPVVRTSYSKNDALLVTQAIDAAGGSPFAGMFLTFDYTINGVSGGQTMGLTV